MHRDVLAIQKDCKQHDMSPSISFTELYVVVSYESYVSHAYDTLAVFFQIDWLNKYHKDCREKVGKMLKDQGKQDVYDWLVEITKPVEQKGGTPTAGSVTLTLSAITWMSVAAISMFLFV